MDWRISRVLQAILTVYLVITLSFILIRFMPGDPLNYIIAQAAGGGAGLTGGSGGGGNEGQLEQAMQLAEIYMSMNPTDPLHIAYYDYMVNMLQGDLGRSIRYNQPVTEIMAFAIPWTLFVTTWGLFIGFFLGIILGSMMAYREGSTLDVGMTSYSVIMTSTPYYVMALLLLLFFGYRWGWFPTSGRQPEGVTTGFNLPFIKGIIYHAALPVLSTIVLSGIASLTMRGNSIRVLGEDYLYVARLRGLSDIVIATQYVARNAILPVYTGMMISIGSLFGGSVVLEVIFRYRGMGFYLVEAAHARDYPLMMGGFMVITIAVVIALIITDITYSWIDPRAGNEGRETY